MSVARIIKGCRDTVGGWLMSVAGNVRGCRDTVCVQVASVAERVRQHQLAASRVNHRWVLTNNADSILIYYTLLQIQSCLQIKKVRHQCPLSHWLALTKTVLLHTTTRALCVSELIACSWYCDIYLIKMGVACATRHHMYMLRECFTHTDM